MSNPHVQPIFCARYAQRREKVFLLLAGIFLSTLTIMNVLGLSRFIHLELSLGSWSLPFKVPLGVLPYPITFLCTDIISEFYGKQRAKLVVWVGLIVNLWLLFILWLGGILPPLLVLDPHTHLPPSHHSDYAFYWIRLSALGGIIGSMTAYLVAQLLDIHLFHFYKKLTSGKHLWLRNTASTLISQLVDTFIVLTMAYFISGILPLAPENAWSQLWQLILASYGFKVIAALLDTIPCYLTVFGLKRYFGLTKKNDNIYGLYSDPTTLPIKSQFIHQ